MFATAVYLRPSSGPTTMRSTEQVGIVSHGDHSSMFRMRSEMMTKACGAPRHEAGQLGEVRPEGTSGEIRRWSSPQRRQVRAGALQEDRMGGLGAQRDMPCLDKTSLIETVQRLRGSPLCNIVTSRLDSFRHNRAAGFEVWFSELSFCILVAASTARSGLRAQSNLGGEKFLLLDEDQLRMSLKSLGVRFHNRAHYIVEARELGDFTQMILNAQDVTEARDWIVSNVKGIGYKEASHFLRNIGFLDVAILDRHILNTLKDANCLPSRLPPKNRAEYLELEQLVLELAKEASMPAGELDLYLWYMRTGDIVK